jgi:SAM-dependent methyltransferase
MTDALNNINKFVEYVRTLKGDEKGEAQVFCDRLFQAFGHAGYKEAGAELEFRVKAKGKTTKFADLLWRPRLLLEMKKRGEKLEKHYQQAFEYWLELVPQRPKYVVLCNFDKFWVYDFDLQLREPVDRVNLEDLPHRFTAFNFLFPENRKPFFNNNQIDVTRTAADKVALVFNRLVERGEKVETAQRFILQCVVALFAEDLDLLPRGLFTEFLGDCQMNRVSSYDLIGGLFRQMGSARSAPKDSRYRDVSYFNGGIFSVVEPIALTRSEIDLLLEAAKERWSKVEPAIFGALFESSMGKEERHALGAHYTSEADIQKVVLPTIIRPWRERIEAAKTLKDLLALRQELLDFKVLDPACGSGNFLYVAYRELKRLEAQLLTKIHENFSRAANAIGTMSLVKTSQFYGIDIKPFAVELAKVTLMLAKKLALDEENQLLNVVQMNLPLELDRALPLDNLDRNIRCDDALFCEWTEANAIIGNPPYLGSRYIAKEHGYDYAGKIYAGYPDVPKMADYCVYWFRRTHENLPQNGRAGLVATNTVRQNETRQASLDYIVANSGTITEAVSTQVWSGDAAVHVSIISWIKGDAPGEKKLYTQEGDDPNSPYKLEIVEYITSSLSSCFDVTEANFIAANKSPKVAFVGQYPFNAGFLLTPAEAQQMLGKYPDHREVIFPYMIGRDLIENYAPSRWIIDFAQRDFLKVMKYKLAFDRVQKLVMPDVLAKAEKEKQATGKDSTRWTRMAQKWWQFRDYQPGTMAAIAKVPRYVVCSRVTKRPIFEFISNQIHPDNALVVFSLADDYSFGILQSGIHWAWFVARCSTLKGDFRYTSNTVFDSFPFPQSPTLAQAKKVAAAAVKLRQLRRKVMTENQWSLRELYRTLDLPGDNPLRKAQAELDAAVREAYGMKAKDDPLKFLLELNFEVADRETKSLPVVAPGLPPVAKNASEFITDDCVRMPE